MKNWVSSVSSKENLNQKRTPLLSEQAFGTPRISFSSVISILLTNARKATPRFGIELLHQFESAFLFVRIELRVYPKKIAWEPTWFEFVSQSLSLTISCTVNKLPTIRRIPDDLCMEIAPNPRRKEGASDKRKGLRCHSSSSRKTDFSVLL
jgi:hypothetical protein